MSDEIPTLQDAQEAYEAGDVETALSICDGLIGEDEERADPGVLYLAGECLLELQEPEEALRLFEIALKDGEDEALLLHCKGVSLFELGRVDEAAPLFARALAAEPELADAAYYLGLVAERGGDHGAAARRYAEAARLDPENFVEPVEHTEEAILAAFRTLAEEVGAPLGPWLLGLPLEVADLPEAAQLRRDDAPISPLVHCLFLGEPADGPEGDDPEVWLKARPTRVLLFRRNLGKSATDVWELEREVAEAVLWEAVEFLGLDDASMAALGILDLEDEPEEE